jgi:hypothetical protein
MVFGRVASHHQHYVSILEIYPVIRHCTATIRLSQSRNSCGVSYSGLMFYIDKPKGTEPFLEDITFFIIKCSTAHVGNGISPVNRELFFDVLFCAVRLFFLDL